MGESEILSPSESVKIAYFVLFKMLGGSEILSLSESVKIAHFVLFKMLGGIRNSEPLRFGENSLFCSA